MLFSLSILDSLCKLSTNSRGPLKFSIRNALFVSFQSQFYFVFVPIFDTHTLGEYQKGHNI